MHMKREQFLKKHGIKIYDTIELRAGANSHAGTIMPADSGVPEDVLVLKLKSGYNVGVRLDAGTEVKKTGTAKKPPLPEAKPQHNPSLPTIAVVQVGGTIVSRVDYETGGVSSEMSAEGLLAMFPRLGELANYRFCHVANIFSENLRFGHYSLIAEAVAEEIKKGARGVLVAHGTDTMAYTSAALSFMLENVPVPVLLVGAQRSPDRGSTDAALNLLCAAHFITKSDFAGVAICMHENMGDEACLILPATKTRKMHSSRRDAFRAINAKPIARVDASGTITFTEKNYPRRNPNAKFVLRGKIEDKVALVKVTPALHAAQIGLCRKLGMKGVVIEGTGLGHIPSAASDKCNSSNAAVMKEVKALAKSGTIVAMATQCLNGRVMLHVYSTGILLRNAGVHGAEDMLPETALIKLAWLLGNFKKAEVPVLFRKNLRGEISPSTPLDAFPQDFAPCAEQKP